MNKKTLDEISIVLADDHPIVRQGLRALFESEPGFTVVGEAKDGRDAVHLVEQLRPAILILDLMMPGWPGLEVLHQVRRHVPVTCVVVLSMHDSRAHIKEALRIGAAGYVLKDAPAEELIHAVREAAEGHRYLSAGLSARVAEKSMGAAEPLGSPYDSLTTREREVLLLASEGHSCPEIGERLFISPRTAEVHRANLMRKLGLRNQTDLIRCALRLNLIPGA